MALREHAMRLLRTVASEEAPSVATSVAPRVAMSILRRTTDADALSAVWTMGVLQSDECTAFVVGRIRAEWQAIHRRAEARKGMFSLHTHLDDR